MDCPKSTSEAKAHIAHIRREKGLDGPKVNISDLDAALVLLSEQLYQKSTHFLLELLQNADDNTYPDVCPTLQMTYSDGQLQVSCNEVGFQRSNTEAICRIGRSTKSESGNATRYIGEKGIGFKSVFKVANVVWIHSGFYSFKFDKREKLGMIAPIWAKFPGRHRDGFTSVLLDMEPGQHHSRLLQELRTFDPRLLIFLRKLKKIDISILEKGKSPWKTTLARGDDNADVFSKHHDLQRLSLCRDSEQLRFVVTRHSVTGLPDDPKRPGCTDSEILMAFPVADDGSPCISSQHVYAFLPIRDYGFKFLLQADFLLIASREDIDSSSAWNTHLYNAVPAAVLKAVQLLHQTELRYSWPQYLTSRGTMADFFETLETRITTLLSQSPVLESMTGDMVIPHMLSIITEDYMDNSGLPLTLSDQTAVRYLSSQYSTQVREFLKKLGVGQMDHAQFFDHLKVCFSEHHFLENKAPEWHSCLARRLIAIISQKGGSIDQIYELPIIPLQDGTWTNARAANLLFPSNDQHLTVPSGIQVHQVHRDASEDAHRRQLLVLLGVQPFDASKICEIIAQTHTIPGALDEAMAQPEDVAQHSLFIFHAKWTDPKQRVLWFLAEDDAYRRANELYVGTDAPFFVANVLDDLRGRVNFLHPSYEEQIPEDVRGRWADWLANNQKMNRIPRLTRSTGAASFTISAEFQHLITTWPPTRVLYLLKSYWTQYGVWIEDKHSRGHPQDWERSRKALIRTLSSMEVECRGGRRALLKDTILPLDGITKDGSFDIQAPILDLPDTKAGLEWDFLRYFGVGSKNVMEILVKNLKSIRENGETHTTEEMARLYGEMHQCKDEKGATEKIRLEFKNDGLIFVPPRLEHDETWVNSRNCLWTAPGYIKKTPHLSNYYPELKNFFRDTVRIQAMDVTMLLREMYEIQGGDSLEDISQLFIALSLHLRIDAKNLELSEVKSLGQQRIFPVEKTHSDGRFETLQKAEGNDIWFIADRPHLWRSFTGNIPLLAFSVDTIARMESILDLLPPLRGRLLSANVKGVPVVQGSVQFHKKYTDILRSKAKFISSLISTSSTVKKDGVIKALRTLEVFEAEEVNVEWTVKLSDDRLVSGRADPGRVKLASDSSSLAIYLTKADLDNDIMPVELGEELCKYCGITGASEGILLQQILLSPDHAALKEMVERRGLVVEQFDDDLDELALVAKTQYRLDRDKELLMSFIQDVEGATSAHKIVSRRWEKHGHGKMSPMITRICRLEKQDASILLPSSHSSLLDRIGATPYDTPNQWAFTVPTKLELAQIRQAEEIYPALCYKSRMGTFIQEYPTGGPGATQEAKFLAELTVSRLLERQLGSSYSPTRHWTSWRRSLAGHRPYVPGGFEDQPATFTINNAASEVQTFLALCGYKVAGKLPSNRVFHIDVFASEEGYSEAQVQLSGKQLERAQSYHISPEVSDTVNIFILVGVFKIWKTPQLFLFPDPWTLVLDGRLFLSNPTCYVASFLGEPPSLDLLDLESRPEPRPSSRSRTLEVLTKRWKRGSPSPTPPGAPAMYRYGLLGGPRDIRLMCLEPGSGEMPLCATMVHVTLDYEDMPDFCAISYQWGANLKPYEIETPGGKIPITNSLRGALRCVRKPDQPLMVWADAVCINQDDNHEKCVQIRLMAQIFKAASPVYAWIGEEGDRSSEVMETLIQIRTVALRPDRWPEALPPVPERWRGRSAPLQDDGIWDALDAMLARGWFKRAWVVQEVVLAPRIILCCGNWSANLDDIFEALNICMRRGRFGVMKNSQRNPSNSNAYAAYVLGMTRKSYANPVQRRKYDFLSLTGLFSYTQSTIPRDKLFSLLLLASDAADQSLNPDYESSEETVVRRYARTFVKRGEASRLLYRAGKSRSYSFCSWIPEWTRRVTPGTISDWCGSQGRFSASRSEPIDCDVMSLHGKDHLQIRGVVVDTIESVGSITLQDHDAITYLNALRQSIAGLTEYPTGASISNLKLRVPVGGALHAHLDTTNDMAAYKGFLNSLDGDDDPDAEARERQQHQNDNLDYEGIRSTIASIGDMVDFLKQPQSLRDKTWKYWHTAVSLAKRLSCARFCVTRRGYAGLVPQDACVGQEIAVLHGLSVPFVINPNGNGSHELVGECYIEGIMYGASLSFEGTKETHIMLA